MDYIGIFCYQLDIGIINKSVGFDVSKPDRLQAHIPAQYFL